MGFLTMGVNKPRQFNHIPIYYDPEKEKKEKETPPPSNGEFHTSIKRGSFRKTDERDDLMTRIAKNHKEIVKLSVLLMILVALGMFIYYNGAQIISLYFD